MNPDKTALSEQLALVMKVIEQRTFSFMQDELGLVARKAERQLHRREPVVLRDMTAIVGIGSRDGVFIAYSYDQALIEVVNIIVGNCTADLARRGQAVSLTPPVLAIGARIIQGRPGTANAVLSLHFDAGVMDIAFVGPKLLFDEYLNYKEKVA